MQPIRISFFALVTLLAAWTHAPAARAEVPFEDGQRVLFLGDSITQNGRYVDLIEAYLWAEYPEREITVINMGLGGETVAGLTEPGAARPRPTLKNRGDRALKIAAPDWVLVCYGMNDGIYHPVEPRITEAYRAGLDRLLGKIDAIGARAILLSPPVFDPTSPVVAQRWARSGEDAPYGYGNPYKGYDETLAALSRVVESFEDDPRVERVIDVHAAMVDFLRQSKAADPDFVYDDGVHPPLSGHAAMATTVLIGLGEPEGKVHRVLAEIAAVRPPGADAQSLPADDAAESIRQGLFERGGKLSRAYRTAVAAPAARHRAAEDALQQAIQQAVGQERELRERIEEAIGSETASGQ